MLSAPLLLRLRYYNQERPGSVSYIMGNWVGLISYKDQGVGTFFVCHVSIVFYRDAYNINFCGEIIIHFYGPIAFSRRGYSNADIYDGCLGIFLHTRYNIKQMWCKA